MLALLQTGLDIPHLARNGPDYSDVRPADTAALVGSAVNSLFEAQYFPAGFEENWTGLGFFVKAQIGVLKRSEEQARFGFNEFAQFELTGFDEVDIMHRVALFEEDFPSLVGQFDEEIGQFRESQLSPVAE